MVNRSTKITFLAFLLLAGVFFLSPHHALAVARTWDGGGGDNNWSTPGNWSADTVPIAGDTVTFDATSTKATVWDSSGPASISSLTVTSAYSGAFSITKSGTLTITTTWSWAGTGSFSAGTSNLKFTGGAATFTPGSVNYYDLEYFSAGGTPSFTVSGTATVTHNLIWSTTASVSGSGTINVAGDVTGTGTGGFAFLSGTVVLNGTGNQTISSSGTAFGIITVNKPSGIAILSGTVPIWSTWTFTQGTLNAGSSTLDFVAGTPTFTPGGASYNNVRFSVSAGTPTWTINGTATVLGSLSVPNGAATYSGTPGTFNVAGDVNLGGSGIQSTLVFNGAGNQAFTATNGRVIGTTIVNKPSGTLTMSGTITAQGNWTWTAGNLDAGTSTIQFIASSTFTTGNKTYYNITVASVSNTVTLAGNLTVSNALTLTSGNMTTTASNYAITTKDLTNNGANLVANASVIKVSGNFTRTAGGLTAGTSTVVLNGTGQTVSGTTTFYNLYKMLPANTADTLTFTASTTYTIAASGTARFTGTRGNLLSIVSSSSGTAFTLTKTGSVIAEYVSLKDSTISATTSAVASTSVSGNTSWVFTKEFVSTIRASGGDYTTLSSWESALGAIDLTAAATKVFSHGGVTGAIADNSSVTGATSGATGTVVHATSTQILIKSISGTFQSGEQIRVDVSNYVTSSDTGNGAIAVAETYNDWPTALNDSVTISGETTDADNFILVVAPLGQRHKGKLKDDASGYYNGFTLKPSGATAIVLDNQMSFTRIEGVAIDGTNATATNIRLNGTSPQGMHLISALGVDGFSLSGGALVGNSLAYGGTGKCFEDTTGATTNYTVYNSTAVGCAQGFQGNNTTTVITLVNDLASSNSSADFALTNSGAKNVTYSASSDATSDDYAAPTGDRVSQTFSFKDATNKDYHLLKKDTGAKNFGTDLSTDTTFPITDDIEGDVRPAVNISDSSEITYDIGADEYDYDISRFKDGVVWK